MWSKSTVLGDPRQLIELARIGPEVGIVDQPPEVAFEVADVDRIEADERREQAHVGLGDPFAGQVALAGELVVELVQGPEQRARRLLVGLLATREAGLVDAVVDVLVDQRVDRVDRGAERLGVVVAGRARRPRRTPGSASG